MTYIVSPPKKIGLGTSSDYITSSSSAVPRVGKCVTKGMLVVSGLFCSDCELVLLYATPSISIVYVY